MGGGIKEGPKGRMGAGFALDDSSLSLGDAPSLPDEALPLLKVTCSLFSQMKMPSKKLAHIPVYALGFDGPPRGSATKAMPMLRREVFQCVPLPLAVVTVVGSSNSDLGVWVGMGVAAGSPQGTRVPGVVLENVCSGCSWAVPTCTHFQQLHWLA